MKSAMRMSMPAFFFFFFSESVAIGWCLHWYEMRICSSLSSGMPTRSHTAVAAESSRELPWKSVFLSAFATATLSDDIRLGVTSMLSLIDATFWKPPPSLGVSEPPGTRMRLERSRQIILKNLLASALSLTRFLLSLSTGITATTAASATGGPWPSPAITEAEAVCVPLERKLSSPKNSPPAFLARFTFLPLVVVLRMVTQPERM
mmetsp:Transcript_12429/g.49789  ORF Transcript_12429/g.49789 Transcript_12429/m.49789 type:complete len:205 (+) Transcript_12429:765-1379(+)